MMRSLYSGVSGLNNHQTRMDVIGNNISNVNTTGFKRGRAQFQDILSQTLAEAARPTETRGGINPKQVGLGMTVAAIDTIHTQGALQTTGVNTDLAIMGEGFFINRNGENTLYTRNGGFSLDRDGFLVNPANGFRVQGFRTVENPDGTVSIDTQSSLEDIEIPVGKKEAARATTLIRYKSNLNSLTQPITTPNPTERDIIEGTWRTSIDVYDSRGNKQELQINFTKAVDAGGNEVPNQWIATVDVVDVQGRPVEGIIAQIDPGTPQVDNRFLVTFNTAGAIESVQDDVGVGAPLIGPGANLLVNLTYNIAGSEPMNISLDLGTSGQYNGITQFASPSSTRAYFQDGIKMGYLQGFHIDDTGVITGAFTNGIKLPLGQVALAVFTNPGGLIKEGESYYAETNNSGLPDITDPGSRAAGSLKAGTLEMSNVELSEEFTDMIVTQRGFQANSRVITTSDTMLEELLRLKR